MKADDNQPPARTQQLFCCRHAAVQFAQFIIHMDAQRHEGPGGGINAVFGPGNDATDDFCKLQRPGERFGLAGSDNGAGNPAGEAFLAQLADQVGKFLFLEGVDDVRGGRSVLCHAHVQGAVATEGKSTRGIIQLRRRYAKVEHDAVQCGCASLFKQAGQVAEPALQQGQPSVIFADQ